MTIWAPDLSDVGGPRYRAIAEALERDAANGRLEPGTRLPTHRDLADTLGVTVGTVSRAYAEAARRGLISGEVGRGTFLRAPHTEAMRLAPDEGGLIEMSLNHPPQAGLDTRKALAATLVALASRSNLEALLAYPPEGGAPEHRAAGARWIARTGLSAAPEQVLVSNGSQHAMTAVLASMLNPGDVVATESLTYAGMKSLANLLHLRLEGLATDASGLLPDAFQAACRRGSLKALYCVPTIHNPTTAVMPEERRRAIAAIARRHGVTVIEDDVHGLLADAAPPPITSFAPEACIYVTGTAKTLAPGLRIGFVLAPPNRVARLAASIRTTTWMAAPLMAEIAADWIRSGVADHVLQRRRAEAAARQRLAASVLGGYRCDAQPHAYHAWLHLPEPWRSDSFCEQARRRGVAVTPAQTFAVGSIAPPQAVRVCLGPPRDHAQLEHGLRVLANVLEGPPDAGLPVV